MQVLLLLLLCVTRVVDCSLWRNSHVCGRVVRVALLVVVVVAAAAVVVVAAADAAAVVVVVVVVL